MARVRSSNNTPERDSLLGAAVGARLLTALILGYWLIRRVEGMGWGDVKMMAMVGSFLGAPQALLTIMLGSLLGSVIGLIFIRFANKTREYELPFGTLLSFAAIIAVLYAEEMVRWYIEHLIQPVA